MGPLVSAPDPRERKMMGCGAPLPPLAPWRVRGRKNLEALQPFQAFCELAWVDRCEVPYRELAQ